ncbi:YadA-like family protein [Mesorhizobium sp. M0895]|uniref:YadA-like family protein n=1 Tax=unclassified Mesorhizobium TaxID=325217 RepID=UPI00333A1FF1
MLEVPRDEEAFAIVDRIYEAAFAAELWPGALEATSAITRSASGSMFMISDHSPLRAIGEAQAEPLIDAFMADWKFPESVQRMCSTQPASFVRVDDFMTGEEIERDPIYAWARKFGFGSPVCTSISLPSGELVLFVFQRWLKDGKYDQAAIDLLNGLRPHLARAGLVAGRLGLERARTAVSVLSEIGLPAAVMSGSGRVLTANRLLEDMADVFVALAHGGMALALESGFQDLGEQVSENRSEARAGTALALATAGLRYDDRPGKLSMAGGFGHFKGQSGLALGFGYSTSQDFRLNAAVSASTNRGDVGVSVGASWTLN